MKFIIGILLVFIYSADIKAQKTKNPASFKLLQRKVAQVELQVTYLKGAPHIQYKKAELSYETPEILKLSYIRVSAKGIVDTVVNLFHPENIKNITEGHRRTPKMASIVIESSKRDVVLNYRSDFKDANSDGNLAHVFQLYYFDNGRNMFEKIKKYLLDLKKNG